MILLSHMTLLIPLKSTIYLSGRELYMIKHMIFQLMLRSNLKEQLPSRILIFNLTNFKKSWISMSNIKRQSQAITFTLWVQWSWICSALTMKYHMRKYYTTKSRIRFSSIRHPLTRYSRSRPSSVCAALQSTH